MIYTRAQLEAFDRITQNLSSRDQLVRIRARVSEVPAFVKKHGKEKCDAMFEVLKERDLVLLRRRRKA